MRFTHTTILSLFCLLFIFAACSDDDNDIPDIPTLTIDVSSVNFEETAGEKEIKISSNTEWTYKTIGNGNNWCQLRQQNDLLLVSVTANDQKDIRQAQILINASTLSDTITVKQLGWGKAILLSSDNASIKAPGGVVDVEVTTNIDYTYDIEPGCEWISDLRTKSLDEHPLVIESHRFTVASFGGSGQREATIIFKDKENGSDIAPVSFKVIQEGLGSYEPEGLESIKDDIKVKITGGKSSSEQPGEGIELSFDGNPETIYHSSWNNSGDNYFPITLEYYFEAGSDMDYLVYYPRTSGYNGFFKEADIEVCSNTNTKGTDDWQFVMKHNFNGSSQPSRVDFPTSLTGVSAIRFTVYSGVGDGQGFASCAEMEFFKKNPEGFDYSTLFTDPSCSELKPGITQEDIDQCKHSFFKNIAFYMFYNRYDKEFRINTFKSYPHPDIQARAHKTSPYSLLDNPTGISVEEGNQLIVLVDGEKGLPLFIRVQNLDKPNGDGFGGDDYPLAIGTNKINIKHKGLVYVLYHTDTPEPAPDVKIHFATGKVNGYYDSQNPNHKDRWQELLGKAENKYFDVVGKYAHLTFPTQRFRAHTKDLPTLINTFDKIVHSEHQLMGLEKYDRLPYNRMYFNVIYTSYMYATSYHTAYNDETLSELCNEHLLQTSSCWGPSHEVGHCNQTRPGLKWLGTTEVTNNVFSQYIQTTIFDQPSRLQTESMNNAYSPNRYSLAWNNIIVKQASHATEGDVFCKLVPFWQLELYFGKALGMTPLIQKDKGGFYPDVYEYVRTHEDLSTPGEQQIEFAYIASLAAQMDLTDFFTKWGFLRTVDTELDDYGTGRIQITQDQIDQVCQRIKSLGLPQPDLALEYITDNTVEAFRYKAAIEPGTASRINNKLAMKNWKNVIAYEVRKNNANGELVAVSDGVTQPSNTAEFSVKGDWDPTYKVYAVAYNNERIEVKFD